MVTIMAIYGHTLWPYMAIYLWPLWIWQFKNQFPYMAILWYGMAIYGVHSPYYSIYIHFANNQGRSSIIFFVISIRDDNTISIYTYKCIWVICGMIQLGILLVKTFSVLNNIAIFH
jgi:hypothetical protein